MAVAMNVECTFAYNKSFAVARSCSRSPSGSVLPRPHIQNEVVDAVAAQPVAQRSGCPAEIDVCLQIEAGHVRRSPVHVLRAAACDRHRRDAVANPVVKEIEIQADPSRAR